MAIRAGRSGWVVAAASIGAVEALKDQLGVCRWNYPLRSIQQRAKASVQSYLRAQIPNSSSSSGGSAAPGGEKTMVMREKVERREMGVKKVMELSCWGPITVRF